MKKIVGMTVAALFATSSANAAFIMFLDDLSTVGIIDVILQDNTAAGVGTSIGATTNGDATVAAGALNFNGAVGSFVVNVSTGVSKPLLNAPGDVFDLNSVNVSGAAGTIVIGITDTDFMGDASISFSIGGTTGAALSTTAFASLANTEFGGGFDIGSYATSGMGAFAHNGSARYLTGLVNPYSLSLISTITHSGAGKVTSFDAVISVPEPATLALFGFGFLGLGLLSRRKLTK